MASRYRLTVTRDGELLGEVELDGLKLDRSVDRALVGELVEDEMGGDAVRDCAAQPVPEGRD